VSFILCVDFFLFCEIKIKIMKVQTNKTTLKKNRNEKFLIWSFFGKNFKKKKTKI